MVTSPEFEKLNRAAQTAFEHKNYPEAVRLYHQALETINPAEMPAAHAEARNNLSVALLKGGNAQAALDQASGTEHVFAEIRDPQRQAIALGNIAAAMVELQRLDEALQKYQLSADLFKQTGNDEMRSYVLREISVLQMKRGKQVDSLFAMDAALASKKKLNWRESIIKSLMRIVHRMMGTN
jgi:tetratricopeptide (TPR) repeat protein